MMKDLIFKVNHLNFKVHNLIGKDKNNKEVSRLIDHVKATDPACEVTEPMEVDILFESDKWEVYDVFNEKLFFEFLKGKLIYIYFVLNAIDNGVIELSDDIRAFYVKEKLELNGYYSKRNGYYQRALDSKIVIGLVEDENQNNQIKVISFGDYETFTNEENLPNRYSDVLGSLILV